MGAVFPGDRAGLADVEIRDSDLAVGVGQGTGAGELPRSGGLRVLLLLGRYPAVERELHRQATFGSDHDEAECGVQFMQIMRI